MAGLTPVPDRPGAVEGYPTTDDVPDDLEPGTMVYVEEEKRLYFEEG